MLGLTLLGLAACGRETPARSTPAKAPSTTAQSTQPAATATPPAKVTSAPAGAAPVARGEQARFRVEGDVVHVNNELCAVSRGHMGADTLGQFVSEVHYEGDDRRFAGKTLRFNQCCGGCVARFPKMWAERSDEILAFHGLNQ